MDNPIRKIASHKAALFSGKSIILGSLDVELTERCNNNCIHCTINLPENDQDAIRRELPADTIKKIITEAVLLGCMNVRFTGGEPLLREDFKELYLFARKAGLKVTLFTNATLITPELAELMAKIPPLEKIEITIYGMKKSSCEAVTRNRGAFEAAQRGVNLLLENNIPFVVKSALLPPNKKEVKAFEIWASSIKWMDTSPAFSMFFDLRGRRDHPDKNNRIHKLRISPEQGLQFMLRKRDAYIREMKYFCSNYLFLPGDTLFTCGSGTGGACLDAYGFLQPCMPLRHPDTIYHLKRGTVEEAVKQFFPEIRKMKANNTDYLSRCARCFLMGLCDQCPGKSWMEHGTLDKPVAYLCDIAHIQARYLGLVEENENAWEVTNWEKRVSNFSKKQSFN